MLSKAIVGVFVLVLAFALAFAGCAKQTEGPGLGVGSAAGAGAGGSQQAGGGGGAGSGSSTGGGSSDGASAAPDGDKPAAAGSDAVIGKLFEEQQSNVQVRGSGTVTRLLDDDNTGDRHQRFILELASGQTLLVAHNIDVAPRLDGLAVGDTVEFYGVYEYSDKGGTIHWTHRDPDGRHIAGWLKWDGQTFQ